MKKLLFILAVGCITATVGCSDDDADNLYGDFNVPCELQLLTVKAKNGGGEFPLVLAEARDTVYTYTYTVNDTLKDETTGEPVIGSDGNYVITKVPQEYQGPIRARYYIYEPITVPMQIDTFYVDLESNARWTASTPKCDRGSWCSLVKNSGGGTGQMQFRCTTNNSRLRTAYDYVYSNDSTVMCKFTIHQVGARD